VTTNVEDARPLIVPTNYDDTMERALELAGEEHDVVSYVARRPNAVGFVHLPSGEDDPRRIAVPSGYAGLFLAARTVVLKLYLATSDPLSALPMSLGAKLQPSRILFPGYGLKDWNLRVIVRRLWGAHEPGLTSWAVQVDPDEVEKRFWKGPEVDIIEADLTDYIEQLGERLAKQLRERPGVGEDVAAVS
jgi:hypothetical protein